MQHYSNKKENLITGYEMAADGDPNEAVKSVRRQILDDEDRRINSYGL